MVVRNHVLEKNGMTKNKSKVMVMLQEKVKTNIKIEGVEIEQVITFQYLGLPIEDNGRQEIEINNKITVFSQHIFLR